MLVTRARLFQLSTGHQGCGYSSMNVPFWMGDSRHLDRPALIDIEKDRYCRCGRPQQVRGSLGIKDNYYIDNIVFQKEEDYTEKYNLIIEFLEMVNHPISKDKLFKFLKPHFYSYQDFLSSIKWISYENVEGLGEVNYPMGKILIKDGLIYLKE